MSYKDCCKNCRYRRGLERYDYDKVKTGNWNETMEGYVCAGFGDPMIWMVGDGDGDGLCEMFEERNDGRNKNPLVFRHGECQ